MATIRENARYGTALWVVVTAGCVATDQPLFETVAAPELRADPVGGSAPSSAAPAAAPEPQPLAEQAPLPISLEPPVMALQAEALPSPEPPAPEPPPALPEPSVFEPCSSPGLLLCDTFEADAVGSFPAAEHWLDELPGCGTHRVGEVDVGPPSRALLSQQGGYPECMLHADLGEQADFYVRSRVRLGPEPELREQYLSLLEIGARAAQDEPELRVGSRPSGGSLCGNTPGLDVSVSGLGSGSSTDCAGVELEPERWYCLQVHVTRSERRLDYTLAIDGVEVLARSDIRLGGGWNDDSVYLKLGRAAYGQSPSGSVWHDDVAVGSEPLPCPP
jgi:hypothetical protein